MAGAEIICCLCGEPFDERALEGGWLDRRCPKCGGRLSEEVFDAAALEVIERHRPELGRRGRGRLTRLALGRYYVSEWFRGACAGQGSEAPDQGMFGLVAGYDERTGAFTLVPGDQDRSAEGGWGVAAEYAVFDAIRAEIVRPGSPLAQARLVPNLVFPWLPGQKPKQWGARHRAETDSVLLCASCAVVVEVKRRNHHVRVTADSRHVRERRAEGTFKSAPDALEQVARGADSLAERQKLYPRSKIFELVVYVDALGFESRAREFREGRLVSCLDAERAPAFMPALLDLAGQLEPIASAEEVARVADALLEKFGHTHEGHSGRIVSCSGASAPNRRRTSAMLDDVEALTRDGLSPLHGARLLRNLVCEAELRGRKGKERVKRMELAGLLLTRTHAVLIDAKRWPVHVNTHVPFATVYTGDPQEGAELVADSIRHDWDLDAISYRNRSGSLTLLTYMAKSLDELDAYRRRNRVCTLNVFIDPASFCSDSERFRQKTYLGFWQARQENVTAALADLVVGADPVLTQKQLDRLADGIAS